MREEIYCREAIALGLDKGRPGHPAPSSAEDGIRLGGRGDRAGADGERSAQPIWPRTPMCFAWSRAYRFVTCTSTPRVTRALPSRCAAARRRAQRFGTRRGYLTCRRPVPPGPHLRRGPRRRHRETVRRDIRGEARRAAAGPLAGPDRIRLRRAPGLRRRSRAGPDPALIDVRDRVSREWANAQRLEANEAFYRGLQKKYRVSIER